MLPSRERGTALPRPRPTILPAVAKGKQRRRSVSSEDWVPEASEDGNSPGSSSMELEVLEEDDSAELSGMGLGENQEEISMSDGGGSGEEDENGDDGARAAIVRILEARDKDMNNAPGAAEPSGSRDTNNAPGHDDNQDLRQTVRDLTQLVLQLVSKPNATAQLGTNSQVKKPRGSTFRVSDGYSVTNSS